MNSRRAPKTTRAAEGLPRRPFTVADVEAMVEAGLIDPDERVELIGGELVPMSPKGSRHEFLKIELLARWAPISGDRFHVAPATTFRLSEDTFLEPDIVIYERALGLSGIRGDNVLLVVEVADASLRYDLGRKAELYASFDVRELWVIDAVKMVTRRFRGPAANCFVEMRDFAADEEITPAFAPGEFALRLDTLQV